MLFISALIAGIDNRFGFMSEVLLWPWQFFTSLPRAFQFGFLGMCVLWPTLISDRYAVAEIFESLDLNVAESTNAVDDRERHMTTAESLHE